MIIQSPVYYPFSEVITNNERNVVSSDLYFGDDNRYHMDYEDFEKRSLKMMSNYSYYVIRIIQSGVSGQKKN